MARDRAPLHGLDLNLLVTLRALLREHSVTRAAERLGQTQPTVSRALATLRTAFDDELLVRSGRSMAPTPLAASLREPLERTLASLDRLPSLGDFDPAADDRTFRILVPDLIGQRIVPALMDRLGDAPKLRLQVFGSEHHVLRALLDDEVDLAVGAPVLDHPELYRRRVGAPIPWRVVLGRAVTGDTLTVAQWLATDHLQLVPEGRPDDPGGLDRWLTAQGLARNVRLHVAYVSAVGEILSRTAMTCTLPTLVADAVAAPYELRVIDHPLADELPPLPLHLTWHEARHGDAGHRWLRDRLAAAIDHLTEAPSHRSELP